MYKPDEGHYLTEKELSKLEHRIASVYRDASKELQETIDDYFQKFSKRDAEMKSLIGAVQNGKDWTEADYKRWRLNQLSRGERFQALKNKLAQRITAANETAVAYVNDATPGIYSLNRNYAAYTIEKVSGNADFTLWDEQTAKRLIVEQPNLMPYYPPKRAVKRGIDLAYGKKQITASVTSSILQGKSIKGIADDLQHRLTAMSRDSAIRTARTAVTGAQNAGRQDSYVAAEKMGIEMEKEWVSALDSRTRPEHAEADGQVVPIDEPFIVGGEKLMYPGDRSGSPWNIYNCRCTQIAKVKGVDTSDAQRRAIDPETGKSVLISNMSYAEWAGWKNVEAEKTNVEMVIEKINIADNVSDIAKIMSDETKSKVDLSGMDIDLAKTNMSQIINLGKEYGYNFNEITTTAGRKYLGEVSRSGRYGDTISVLFPKKYYKDEQSLLSELRKAAQSGEMPSGIGRRNIQIYTVTHEFAHTLTEELTTRLYGRGSDVDFWDEIETVYQSAKKSGLQSLGKYALTNQNEFMAEAFASAKLSANPDETALKVLEIVDRYFKK